jgi:hypothetical protein
MFSKHMEQISHPEPYFNKYLEAYEFEADNEIQRNWLYLF